MARRYYSSTAARTTLASSVSDSATTMSVVAVSGWPTSFPYTLIVDQDTVNEEVVSVTGRTGTTLTVTRGVDGTSAVAHDAGAAVQHGVSARDFDEPNAFINGTGVVTETLLDDGAVTEAKLGTGAVTSAKILDGTIVNADVNASAAIAQSKIANLTSDLASKLDANDGVATGNIQINKTESNGLSTTGIGDGAYYGAEFVEDGNSTILRLDRQANSGNVVIFTRGGSASGTISVTASSTTYATSSDHRLKENVVSISDALTRLNDLKPVRFTWKQESETEVDGFLAHEAQAVVPEAVTGHKDEVDENGDPVYQGIDQSKLVPLLVAAVQELSAEVAALKAAQA